MIPISFRQKRSPCRSVSDCSRLLNCLYRKQSEKCSAKCDRGFTSVCAVGRLKAVSDDTIFAPDCLRFASRGVGRNLTQSRAIGCNLT